jgi:predicted HTH domain antitoxin
MVDKQARLEIHAAEAGGGWNPIRYNQRPCCRLLAAFWRTRKPLTNRWPSPEGSKIMQTVSLKLEIPSDLLAILRKSRQEMEREIQLWTALELFRQRQVSAGKAAELAGVSLADFMDLTRQHGVEWVSYTDEELEVELREAKTLR